MADKPSAKAVLRKKNSQSNASAFCESGVAKKKIHNQTQAKKYRWEETARKKKLISVKKFLIEAPIKFKSQFIYDENFSKSLLDEMEIYCTKHNEKFFQTPTAHRLGTTKCSGCREEKIEKQFSERRTPLKEFIKKANRTNITSQYYI